MRPAAILTDIEGTTTPIRFVQDCLFPYAAARLEGFLARQAGDAEIAAALAETMELAPGVPPAETLRRWMAADAKIGPLKTVQGRIWEAGYASGAIRGALYPDVAPALRRWRAAGIGLAVYSSGSVAAQRLLFGHSEAGDLQALFDGFYDTAMGPKRAAESYRAISRASGIAPESWLFLSDVGAELDAAAAAGFATCQVLRPEDGTMRAAAHPAVADFTVLASGLGL